MARGRLAEIVLDRTEDLPPSKRKCDRCGQPAATLWAMRMSASQIALCGEHTIEHFPALDAHEWFRVECHKDINPLPLKKKAKRRARLVR